MPLLSPELKIQRNIENRQHKDYAILNAALRESGSFVAFLRDTNTMSLLFSTLIARSRCCLSLDIAEGIVGSSTAQVIRFFNNGSIAPLFADASFLTFLLAQLARNCGDEPNVVAQTLTMAFYDFVKMNSQCRMLLSSTANARIIMSCGLHELADIITNWDRDTVPIFATFDPRVSPRQRRVLRAATLKQLNATLQLFPVDVFSSRGSGMAIQNYQVLQTILSKLGQFETEEYDDEKEVWTLLSWIDKQNECSLKQIMPPASSTFFEDLFILLLLPRINNARQVTKVIDLAHRFLQSSEYSSILQLSDAAKKIVADKMNEADSVRFVGIDELEEMRQSLQSCLIEMPRPPSLARFGGFFPFYFRGGMNFQSRSRYILRSLESLRERSNLFCGAVREEPAPSVLFLNSESKKVKFANRQFFLKQQRNAPKRTYMRVRTNRY